MKLIVFYRLASAVALLMLGVTLGSGVWADSQPVNLDSKDTGRIFQGIGGLSAGASSRLLIDYPKKQRNEILDYLFKPDFGAALQINKVEIGGDTNSTDGSEPSHMHTATDQNYHRGYEWWLMEESKKRNPNVKLYALEWGTPGWINPNNNDVWTDNNTTYLLNWLSHAKSDYGLSIDYIGGWNERGYSKLWYENFHEALVDHGFGSTQVVGDDSFNWDAAGAMADDPKFTNSVDIIGQHYPDVSPVVTANKQWQLALQSGKRIWLSEMGSQPADAGAGNLARVFNDGYINARATAYINWSTIWAVYKGYPYQNDGFMVADEPWSGYYQVNASIWVVAQTTQFVSPGWQYLDHACGYLAADKSTGSYVSFKSPDNSNYSIVIETVDAGSPQTFSYKASRSFPTGAVHVWCTDLKSHNSSDWFVRQADLQAKDGVYSILLQPGEVYSLTTTSGQRKGESKPPVSQIMGLPYSDNFQGYPISGEARYFADQMGAFEVARTDGGRSGKCLEQVCSEQPVVWDSSADPCTVFGDTRWKDYTVSSDYMLPQHGYVDLIGRMAGEANANQINGYRLRVDDAGAWSLIAVSNSTKTVLAGGSVPLKLGTWHNLALSMVDDTLAVAIDGRAVASGIVDESYSHGQVGYGVSPWVKAQFQNFSVRPLVSHALPEPILSATASSFQSGYEAGKAVDGDESTIWHTQYDPSKVDLPQSIVLDTHQTLEIKGLRYLPRQDGILNGNITHYNVYTSMDGNTFTKQSSGMWTDDSSAKLAMFAPVLARYVKLEAIEGHGGFASAAEIKVLYVH